MEKMAIVFSIVNDIASTSIERVRKAQDKRKREGK
jgi:hypothetical protein